MTTANRDFYYWPKDEKQPLVLVGQWRVNRRGKVLCTITPDREGAEQWRTLLAAGVCPQDEKATVERTSTLDGLDPPFPPVPSRVPTVMELDDDAFPDGATISDAEVIPIRDG